MIINTNVSSLVTQNALRKVNLQMENNMTRLSTGKRINTAADDAAGLAISSRMTSQVKGKDVAARNANDGISLLQTAEGSLGTMETILQRMRELAIQSKNDTNSALNKAALDKEFKQLIDELEDIALKSTFNGIKVLDGSTPSLVFQVGDQKTDTVTVNLANVKTDATGLNMKTAPNTYVIDILSAANANTAMDSIDNAITLISNTRADFGGFINRLNYRVDDLNTNKTNLTAARSRIEDADMASEMSELTRNRIINQSSMAMLAQANQKTQGITTLLQQN